MNEERTTQDTVKGLPTAGEEEKVHQFVRRSHWGVAVIVGTLAIACIALSVEIVLLLPSRPQLLRPLVAYPEVIDLGMLPQGGIADAGLVVKAQTDTHGDFVAQGEGGMTFSPFTFGKREYTRAGWLHVRRLVLRVDTEAVGTFELNLHISHGSDEVDVPVRFSVRERSQARRRVLVAQSAFVDEFTSDDTVLDAWRRLVARADLEVDLLDTESEKDSALSTLDLAPYETVLLAETALRQLEDPAFRERLIAYVGNGGKLVIAASALLGRSVQRTNQLVTPYGLEVVYKDIPDLIVPEPGKTLDIPGITGVARLWFHRASPIRITNPAQAVVIVPAPGYPGWATVAGASLGKGEIIVVGQSRWRQWIGDKGMVECDNARLLEGLLTQAVVAKEPSSEAASPSR